VKPYLVFILTQPRHLHQLSKVHGDVSVEGKNTPTKTNKQAYAIKRLSVLFRNKVRNISFTRLVYSTRWLCHYIYRI